MKNKMDDKLKKELINLAAFWGSLALECEKLVKNGDNPPPCLMVDDYQTSVHKNTAKLYQSCANQLRNKIKNE